MAAARGKFINCGFRTNALDGYGLRCQWRARPAEEWRPGQCRARVLEKSLEVDFQANDRLQMRQSGCSRIFACPKQLFLRGKPHRPQRMRSQSGGQRRGHLSFGCSWSDSYCVWRTFFFFIHINSKSRMTTLGLAGKWVAWPEQSPRGGDSATHSMG